MRKAVPLQITEQMLQTAQQQQRGERFYQDTKEAPGKSKINTNTN